MQNDTGSSTATARPTTAGPHPEFRLGGLVLFAAMIGTATGSSPIPFNSMGYFIGPLHEEFGWSYKEISLCLTIYGVLGAILAPVYGLLADRFGVRPVALLALLAFGLAFAALGLTPPTLMGFYFIWFVIGLVGIASTPITWSRAVNLWFFRNRGLALGMMLVGTSITLMLLPTLTLWAIGEFGWRKAYFVLALLPLAIGLPITVLWFREPKPAERPPELRASSGANGALPGLTLGQAAGTTRLWILIASIFLITLAYGGALVHLPEMMRMETFSGGQIATVMTVLGLAIFVGRLVTGALMDRFWAPLVALPLLALPAISCWLLAAGDFSFQIALLCAALLGLSGGAETDVIAYLASRYFGMARYGSIYGVLYGTFGMSAAISPAIYGRVRDLTGNYDAMLHVGSFLFLIGAALLLLLGRYPDFSASSTATADAQRS